MIRAVLAALMVFAINPPAAVANQPFLQLPGTVMVQAESRRKALLQLNPEQRQRYCGVPASGWPRHGPQKNVTRYEQPGQDLALTLMRASAVHLAAENPNTRRAARRAVIHNLRYWAKHQGLSRLKGELHANHYYNLDRTLLPLIVSYGLVRDDPKVRDKDRDAIEGWLGGIVMRRGPQRDTDPEKVSSRNNHSYLRASVSMAWGALEGDPALFLEGIAAYERALSQLNPDGALPLELARGTYSLSYHRHALASLVAIAEMAFVQGHDLYSLRNDRGQSLHTLVAYLADGLDKPLDQDLFFLEYRGHDRHYMSWFEAYEARFPERPATRAIRAVLQERDYYAHLPLDDYSGAVTSCLFRPLASEASRAINN